MKIKWSAVTLFVALVMVSGLSCHSNSLTPDDNSQIIPRKTSLEEARDAIGVDVPIPAYLPRGCEIQEVYILEDTIILIISGKNIGKELITDDKQEIYDFQCDIEMNIRWYSEKGVPVRLPTVTVKIDESTGFLQDRGDKNALWWNWYPNRNKPGMFELVLLANKEIPIEELVRIAESVGW